MIWKKSLNVGIVTVLQLKNQPNIGFVNLVDHSTNWYVMIIKVLGKSSRYEDDFSKTNNLLIYFFRCMPNKKGFHFGLPKSWGSYQVPQDPIKIASMMLDFLEVITKELWLKSNAFVQSQSIFIHLRYGKKTQYYYGFFC